MAKTGQETLGRFIDRVMKEKGLSRKRVEVMSGGAIKASYVGSIVRGEAKNPSVDKMKALARGIGVDEEVLFRIARGERPREKTERSNPDIWYTRKILKMTDWILTRPDLLDSLLSMMKFDDEDQRAVVDSIKKMVEGVRQ